MGNIGKKKSNNQISKKTHVIEFMGMISEKYGAIEKYNIELSSQLLKKNVNTVLVYNALPENETYLSQLEKQNVQLEIISPKKSFFSKSIQVIKLIKKYKPILIHCHFNFPFIRIIVFWSWILNVPKRFVSVRSMPGQSPKLISKLWYFGLSLITTNFLTVSNAIKVCLLENYIIKKNKVKLVRRGVDLTLFDQTDTTNNDLINLLNISDNSKIIGSIAFHHYVKGVDLLLEVMNLIVNIRKRNDVILFQIGFMDGRYHLELIEYTKKHGLEKNVIWLGLRDDVPEILKKIEVYCQPSRSEGLGLSIVEAFGANKPVVAFNVGGISEVVNDNVSGYLIKPFDIDDMANKLLLLLDNKELSRKFGENGCKFVNENYQLKNQVSKMIEVYGI